MGKKKGPCWRGYKQIGMKEKNGREVPNCVPINEGSFTDIDQVFQNYANRNLIMNFDDKEFVNFLTDLETALGDEDEAADFISSGEAEPYLKKYSIDLVEPEDFKIDIDTTKVPTRMPDIGGEMGPAGVNEIRRMQELAGIKESSAVMLGNMYMIVEDGTERPLNPGLVFQSTELRDTGLQWLNEPANYISGHQIASPPFAFEKKDATGIIFSAKVNESKGIKTERLANILEKLTKKMPGEWGASVTEYAHED